MQTFLLLTMMFSVFAGIAIGIPVMMVLLGIPILFGLFGAVFGVFDTVLFSAIPTRIFGILGNQILFAVPLFILLGKLVEHTGLAERALQSITTLFSRSGKTLSLGVIGISVAIACSSGVVGATITMLAAIALPSMLKYQLGERFSAGLITASGSLGQIIPPSIVLILLSDQVSGAHIANQLEKGNFSPEPISVGHLFAGALVPGFCLALAYAIYVVFNLRNQPETSSVDETLPSEMTVDWFGLIAIGSLLLVPVSILLGVATATEASAIGVLVVAILAVIGGRLSDLRLVLTQTVELTGVIFGIIVSASVFALVLRGFNGDELVYALFAALPSDGMLALMLVMAVVFVLGFLIEFIEITYIVVPITAPVLFSLGIDPIWFAILMAVNLQISFLTPPMGISLFYYKSATNISSVDLYKSVIPYIAIQLFFLAILFFYPPLATWLPSILI
ncbi:MAG: TRAP transporter large permease subunit [Pseudomonadota bacterium]